MQKKPFYYLASTPALIVSGILTAAVCLVMNLWLIPAIEGSTGGIRCFDMNFGYSYETAKLFLERLSDEGRRIYLTRQLPLDFFYPVAYTAFFMGLTARLRKKADAFLILPAALMALDVIENVCTIVMLKSASLSAALAGFASAVTVGKTLLMYAEFAVLIVLAVLYFKNKKAKKE